MCTLRNLSYRLELEVPQARLLGLNELDDLLGKESPSKDSEPSCWGKKKKKKKRTPQEDQVSISFSLWSYLLEVRSCNWQKRLSQLAKNPVQQNACQKPEGLPVSFPLSLCHLSFSGMESGLSLDCPSPPKESRCSGTRQW